MEIKILCPCGTKFKFAWEPQRDGMPSRINCPGCALDVTLEARAIIRQLSGATPPPVGAVPPPVPLAPSPPPARVLAPPPLVVPRSVVTRAANADGEDSGKTKMIVVSILLVVLIVGGYGVWKVGQKVAATVGAVREIAGATKDVNTEVNLLAMDEVILYVNHSNHLEVAQACTEFWQTTLHKKLVVVRESEDEESLAGDYPLLPPHNGYVRIMGPLAWPEAQYEGLARFLSTRLRTRVFETRDVDFTGAFHFGVYESGERKFHAQMEIAGNLEEKITVENEAWALAQGFQPGEQGFEEFGWDDADAITRLLGLKMWDELETDEPPPHLLLRETPAAGGP